LTHLNVQALSAIGIELISFRIFKNQMFCSGHYVTDVYHTGYGTWLHCDDSAITETSEQSVITPAQTSTPYILFYRLVAWLGI